MTKGEISMRIVTLFTNYYSIYGELLIIISHSRGMLEKTNPFLVTCPIFSNNLQERCAQIWARKYHSNIPYLTR